MKKVNLLLLILVANLSLLSCTAESISEVTSEPIDLFASGDGEDGKESEEEVPPSGGGS